MKNGTSFKSRDNIFVRGEGCNTPTVSVHVNHEHCIDISIIILTHKHHTMITCHFVQPLRMNSVENGRNTPLLFSTFIFEYEHEIGNDITGNEIENELSVSRKRTNSIGIMSNTVGTRKFNAKYRPTVHNLKNVHDQTKKCMIT